MSQVFNLDMLIADAMAVHPRVAEVFASYHLGGCSHCAISQDETIGQVTTYYGVDPEMLLESLDSLLESEGVDVEEILKKRDGSSSQDSSNSAHSEPATPSS